MRKFRKFFEAATGNFPKPLPVTKTAFTGTFNFPDLSNVYDPTRPPPGGWNSWQQLVAANIEKERKSGKHRDLWAMRDMLQRFAQLAEQARAAIEVNSQTSSGSTRQEVYPSAKWVDTSKTKIFLTKADIIGHTFPKMRILDVDWGQDNGILIPNGPDGYILDSMVLNQLMENLLTKLQDVSYQDQLRLQRADLADRLPSQILGKLTSGGSYQKTFR